MKATQHFYNLASKKTLTLRCFRNDNRKQPLLSKSSVRFSNSYAARATPARVCAAKHRVIALGACLCGMRHGLLAAHALDQPRLCHAAGMVPLPMPIWNHSNCAGAHPSPAPCSTQPSCTTATRLYSHLLGSPNQTYFPCHMSKII